MDSIFSDSLHHNIFIVSNRHTVQPFSLDVYHKTIYVFDHVNSWTQGPKMEIDLYLKSLINDLKLL